MKILLNTKDHNCYNFDIPMVAPQIYQIHQKAEGLIILVIVHFFYDFLTLSHSGQLILASSVCYFLIKIHFSYKFWTFIKVINA